jgi:hypothetical protein
MQAVENTERSHRLDSIITSFPSLMEMLLGSLMIEIEDNCLQIKQFMSLNHSLKSLTRILLGIPSEMSRQP